MSYRSSTARRPGEHVARAADFPAQAPEHRAYDHGHRPSHPRHAHARPSASDYMFTHGRRRVRIGPVAFWICVGTLVVMAGWTMVTATYFAFKDDVLKRLLARQSEMQHAYEDRIAEMRTQIDRVTSRQLLDQEQFEQKLDQIARRQAALESRTTTLSTLADPTITGSIKGSVPPASHKPIPLSDRGAKVERGLAAIVARFTGRNNSGGLTGTLARLQESLDRVETRQASALANIEEGFNGKARRIRSVLVELGVEAGKPLPSATGGPFVPLKTSSERNAFDRYIERVNVARSHVDRLTHKLMSVPLRRPLAGELDQSSGFGVRVDPFLGRPAMHTGVDFRGDTGDPVRATATGTVTQAGWSGGYGKMVEIRHGNGLSTRYGHLSEVLVREGQSVKIGQIVGRVGSTGRSTGSHLHYETRRDGDAVDPTRFLRAGAKLGLAF